jgi:hypothetical protein
MPRGRIWGAYVDDDGNIWAVRVDADTADDQNRGWSQVIDPTVPQLARGWLPRKVFGYDSTGRRHEAIVATTDAALWTGAANAFFVETTDAQLVQVDVIGRLEERRLLIRT